MSGGCCGVDMSLNWGQFGNSYNCRAAIRAQGTSSITLAGHGSRLSHYIITQPQFKQAQMQQSRYRIAHPSCPLCLKPYDPYYHLPRILPKCGHTYCQKCIKASLVKKSRLTFTCPQCQTETTIRKSVPEQLPKNVSIVELVKDVKYQAVEMGGEMNEGDGCAEHGRKLEMLCRTCGGVRVCAHCVVFGGHRGHEIGSEAAATQEDLRELGEVVEVIGDTVKAMILPESPGNLEVEARLKVTKGLQACVRDNFKAYYTQISRRQAQLLQQCETITLQEKAGHFIDQILTQFDVLVLKKDSLHNVTRFEVDKIINEAHELHSKIEKMVQSFNSSVGNFLQQARLKIKDVAFFDVRPIDKRVLKGILVDRGSPQSIKSVVNNYVNRQKSYNSNTNNLRNSDIVLTNNKEEQLKSAIRKQQPKQVPQKKSADGQKEQRTDKSKTAYNPSTVTPIKSLTKASNTYLDTKPSKFIPTPSQDPSLKKPPTQAENSVPPKPSKSISTRKVEPKSPEPRSHCKSPSPLHYQKPAKQLHYQLRPRFQSLCAEIDRQPSEGTLQLINQQITDALIPHLCEYLHSRKLKYSMIKLVKNGITDEGCRHLLAYLAGDNYTKVLNLTSNQLTQRTLETVLEFTKINNILKMIYLSNNKITSMQLKKVQGALEAKFVQVVV